MRWNPGGGGNNSTDGKGGNIKEFKIDSNGGKGYISRRRQYILNKVVLLEINMNMYEYTEWQYVLSGTKEGMVGLTITITPRRKKNNRRSYQNLFILHNQLIL